MRNEMLRQIFSDFVGSDEYSENADAIEMDKIRSDAANAINALTGDDLYISIEDYISESECKSEFYGFVMGFKIAMRFMIECDTCRQAVKS